MAIIGGAQGAEKFNLCFLQALSEIQQGPIRRPAANMKGRDQDHV